MKTPWPWIVDPLRELSGVEERRMFGCLSFYQQGNLVVCLTGEGDEPWNGMCLCTGRDSHEALIADFPALAPHRVLGKWLYVSCDHPDFEEVALELVALVANRDPRVGVPPKPARRRSSPSGVSVKKQKIR